LIDKRAKSYTIAASKRDSIWQSWLAFWSQNQPLETAELLPDACQLDSGLENTDELSSDGVTDSDTCESVKRVAEQPPD
jgi:hypothetical protein